MVSVLEICIWELYNILHFQGGKTSARHQTYATHLCHCLFTILSVMYGRIYCHFWLVYGLIIFDWLGAMSVERFISLFIFIHLIHYCKRRNGFCLLLVMYSVILSFTRRIDGWSSSAPGGRGSRGINRWGRGGSTGISGGRGYHWIAVWCGWGGTDRLVCDEPWPDPVYAFLGKKKI